MIIYLEDWQFIVFMCIVGIWGFAFAIASISELLEFLHNKKKWETGE